MSKSTDSTQGKCKWGVIIASFVLGLIALGSTSASLHATDTAMFCGSCHVMSEAVVTLRMSIHAKLDCNDCHLPAGLISRMPDKVAYAIHDVGTNTFGNVESKLESTQKTKDIVQANCRRCHESTTMNVDMTAKPFCTDCHRQVPHMRTLPIAIRKAADV